MGNTASLLASAPYFPSDVSAVSVPRTTPPAVRAEASTLEPSSAVAHDIREDALAIHTSVTSQQDDSTTAASSRPDRDARSHAIMTHASQPLPQTGHGEQVRTDRSPPQRSTSRLSMLRGARSAAGGGLGTGSNPSGGASALLSTVSAVGATAARTQLDVASVASAASLVSTAASRPRTNGNTPSPHGTDSVRARSRTNPRGMRQSRTHGTDTREGANGVVQRRRTNWGSMIVRRSATAERTGQRQREGEDQQRRRSRIISRTRSLLGQSQITSTDNSTDAALARSAQRWRWVRRRSSGGMPTHTSPATTAEHTGDSNVRTSGFRVLRRRSEDRGRSANVANTDNASAYQIGHMFVKPSGLYPSCQWDDKTVKRLILRNELAPRYPGKDDPCPEAREECPICMLLYPALNSTKCCSQRVCTECYLQLRPPRHNKEPCPFCKHRKVEVVFRGARSTEELDREEEEQRCADMIMARARECAARHVVEAASDRVPVSEADTSATALRALTNASSEVVSEPHAYMHSSVVFASTGERDEDPWNTHLPQYEEPSQIGAYDSTSRPGDVVQRNAPDMMASGDELEPCQSQFGYSRAVAESHARRTLSSPDPASALPCSGVPSHVVVSTIAVPMLFTHTTACVGAYFVGSSACPRDDLVNAVRVSRFETQEARSSRDEDDWSVDSQAVALGSSGSSFARVSSTVHEGDRQDTLAQCEDEVEADTVDYGVQAPDAAAESSFSSTASGSPDAVSHHSYELLFVVEEASGGCAGPADAPVVVVDDGAKCTPRADSLDMEAGSSGCFGEPLSPVTVMDSCESSAHGAYEQTDSDSNEELIDITNMDKYMARTAAACPTMER